MEFRFSGHQKEKEEEGSSHMGAGGEPKKKIRKRNF